MLLKDRVAIVSGIGPGMGRDLSLALATQGADLVIAARKESNLEPVAKDVEALGRRVIAVPTDITKATDRKALVEQTLAEFGRVDVLVNNAYATGTFATVDASNLDDWRLPFEVNVLGSIGLAQEVVPAMKANGGGSIVMTSSMVIREVMPMMGQYAASKAALMAATQTMARELGVYQIRVNSVVPGYIWGPSLEAYFGFQAKQRGITPEAVYAEVAEKIALGKIPHSSEIAGAAVFLASDLACAVTGQSIDANGGYLFQ